eukprot:5965962-Ditylum_brightwellii.AAC.1
MGVLLESICDLANKILQNEKWDPTKLYEPNTDLVQKKKTLGDNIPLAKGLVLIVDIPINLRDFINVYVDNTIGLTVDLDLTDNDI